MVTPPYFGSTKKDTVMITTPNNKFFTEAPLRIARRFADADLIDKADSTQVGWLYAHPLLWYRALKQIETDIATHMGASRADLAKMRLENPFPLGNPSEEYRKRKDEIQLSERTRNHVRRIVQRKQEYVTTLINPDTVEIGGKLIGIMQTMADLLADDEVEQARDMALGYVKKWTKHTS